jgi:hypothetical protein
VTKISRPVIYTAILAVAAYAVVVVTEPSKTTKKVTKKPFASRKLGTKAEQFLPEDYKAKYARLPNTVRDSFRPIVIGAGGSRLLEPLRLDGLPIAFTGGDPNWRYTGTAEVNGVREALIENTATGESVWLRIGQAWKNAVLTSIESEAVVMIGPGNITKRLRLGESDPIKPLNVAANTPSRTTLPGGNNRNLGGGGPMSPMGSPFGMLGAFTGGGSGNSNDGFDGGPGGGPGGPGGGPGGPGGPGGGFGGPGFDGGD